MALQLQPDAFMIVAALEVQRPRSGGPGITLEIDIRELNPNASAAEVELTIKNNASQSE